VVAHEAHNLGVVGSSPTPATHAEVAQLAERDLPKVKVAGSIPVFRSIRSASSQVEVQHIPEHFLYLAHLAHLRRDNLGHK